MPRPLIAVLLFVLAPLGFAETYTVTTGADSGPGSLRQAIVDANAHPGPDIIMPSATFTVVLQSPLPEVTDSATIGFAGGLQTLAVDGSKAGANADGFVFTAADCWLLSAVVGGFSGTAVVFRGRNGAVDG